MKEVTLAELKTKASAESLDEFLGSLIEKRAHESRILLELFAQYTQVPPKVWGGKMIGFGQYHYRYDSGREGDWFVTGFAPARARLSIYIMPGFESLQPLLQKLGKHKTGSSCLYINKLQDVDLEVLGQIIAESCAIMSQRYESIEI